MLRTHHSYALALVIVLAGSLVMAQEAAPERKSPRSSLRKSLERVAPEVRAALPHASDDPSSPAEPKRKATDRLRDLTRNRLKATPVDPVANLPELGAAGPFDYSAGNRYLVAAVDDAVGLAIWDATTGRQLRRLESSNRRYALVAISDEAVWIAGVRHDESDKIDLWRADNGRFLRTIQTLGGPKTRLEFVAGNELHLVDAEGEQLAFIVPGGMQLVVEKDRQLVAPRPSSRAIRPKTAPRAAAPSIAAPGDSAPRLPSASPAAIPDEPSQDVETDAPEVAVPEPAAPRARTFSRPRTGLTRRPLIEDTDEPASSAPPESAAEAPPAAASKIAPPKMAAPRMAAPRMAAPRPAPLVTAAPPPETAAESDSAGSDSDAPPVTSDDEGLPAPDLPNDSAPAPGAAAPADDETSSDESTGDEPTASAPDEPSGGAAPPSAGGEVPDEVEVMEPSAAAPPEEQAPATEAPEEGLTPGAAAPDDAQAPGAAAPDEPLGSGAPPTAARQFRFETRDAAPPEPDGASSEAPPQQEPSTSSPKVLSPTAGPRAPESAPLVASPAPSPTPAISQVTIHYATNRNRLAPTDRAWTVYFLGFFASLPAFAIYGMILLSLLILPWFGKRSLAISGLVVGAMVLCGMGMVEAYVRSQLRNELSGELFGCRPTDLSYGACDISVPPANNRKAGDVSRPLSVWVFDAPENPDKHFTLKHVEEHADKDAFYRSLSTQMDKSPARVAMLFVHGYNVSFEDAIFRTAQLAVDLKFPGAAMSFCWPSYADPVKYPFDEQNAEVSIPALSEVLNDLAARSGAQRVHLIAHSMGNRVLAGALRSMDAEAQVRNKAVFSELVMAAPDIDSRVFKTQVLPHVVRNTQHCTLYASSRDRALLMSRCFHNYQRLGEAQPELVVASGLDTIDASLVDTSLLGHSYIGDVQSIVTDLHDLVVGGKRAAERMGLELLQRNALQYWFIKPEFETASESTLHR